MTRTSTHSNYLIQTIKIKLGWVKLIYIYIYIVSGGLDFKKVACLAF